MEKNASIALGVRTLVAFNNELPTCREPRFFPGATGERTGRTGREARFASAASGPSDEATKSDEEKTKKSVATSLIVSKLKAFFLGRIAWCGVMFVMFGIS